MKNKEEIIKEAYGEYYKLCNIDINGYSEEAILYFYLDELDCKRELFRPKSLQGIETNNGWIKIENESDLPKDDGLVYKVGLITEDMFFIEYSGNICSDSNVIDINKENPSLKDLWNDSLITHYQEIKQIPPPLH